MNMKEAPRAVFPFGASFWPYKVLGIVTKKKARKEREVNISQG